MNNDKAKQIARRAFVIQGTVFLGAANASSTSIFGTKEAVKFGVITDLHYADKNPAGSRHYRESLAKIDAAKNQFQKSKIKFAVELGDFIDAAPSVKTELGYLKKINEQFETICSDRHYVLGNHCVDTLTKEEFLGAIGKKNSYYSFDRGDYHFVVLDACFRQDGVPYSRRNFDWKDANIPEKQLGWLKKDLSSTDKKVVVFAHQRLDVSNNHGVKNNAAVRAILEKNNNVLVVFQGHSHNNDLKEINGIHYCTMVAMVEGKGLENNGYSVVTIGENHVISIDGFVKQKDYSISSQKN